MLSAAPFLQHPAFLQEKAGCRSITLRRSTATGGSSPKQDCVRRADRGAYKAYLEDILRQNPGILGDLLMLPLKEERQSPGAGVVADNGPHIVDDQLVHLVFGLNGLPQGLGLLQTVTVADKDHRRILH